MYNLFIKFEYVYEGLILNLIKGFIGNYIFEFS